MDDPSDATATLSRNLRGEIEWQLLAVNRLIAYAPHNDPKRNSQSPQMVIRAKCATVIHWTSTEYLWLSGIAPQ
jgi:hypothetical protein